MTAATLERHSSDELGWHARWHVDKFSAVDERAAAFELFPKRARTLEKLGLIGKADRGGLDRRIPRPDEMRGLGRVASSLVLPHITGDMLLTLGADPVGVVDGEGNLLLNAGINGVLGNRLVGGAATAYNAANTAIGAGDTNTAAAATQTDLSAVVNAANRWVQLADALPTFASQVLTVVATFATANGNFAWAEWAIAQNTASAAAALTASALNRKVAALGTKTSAAAWAFTVTITIS